MMYPPATLYVRHGHIKVYPLRDGTLLTWRVGTPHEQVKSHVVIVAESVGGTHNVEDTIATIRQYAELLE
jgi:hypothetical protein